MERDEIISIETGFRLVCLFNLNFLFCKVLEKKKREIRTFCRR